MKILQLVFVLAFTGLCAIWNVANAAGQALQDMREHGYVTANGLMDWCKTYEYPEAEKDNRALIQCSIMVVSVVDGMEIAALALIRDSKDFLCAPARRPVGQDIRVFMNYMRSHPERGHVQASIVLLAALREAYPCPTGSTIETVFARQLSAWSSDNAVALNYKSTRAIQPVAISVRANAPSEITIILTLDGKEYKHKGKLTKVSTSKWYMYIYTLEEAKQKIGKTNLAPHSKEIDVMSIAEEGKVSDHYLHMQYQY